jgi:hypothetical protein
MEIELPLYLNSGAILFLLLLSVLIVACGSNSSSNDTSLGNPPVTVTIHLGNTNASPTPSLAPYWCGAWATNTTPIYNATTTVGVYAKFTHNVNGNPEGVDAATAIATVTWPDGSTNQSQTMTTSDGLAVFSISTVNKPFAVNGITLVTVNFTKNGIPPCNVTPERAAFFTLVIVSPTATATKVASSTSTTGTPTVTPTTIGTGTPTATCTPIPIPSLPGKNTPTPGPLC